MSQASAERPLKTINCVAYGVGDIYGGGSFFIVSTFAMYYLVAVVGMSPILAGLIPGLGKVWDSVSDPLMGYISDHTQSRRGRRRVFFLIAIAPIAITFSLIWMPVGFASDWALFAYYFLAYLAFYTTTTMALVPYSALSAEMTRDFKGRNKLTGFRMFFSMFATLLAGLFAQPLINGAGGGRQGHLIMGVAFGLLFALPWLFVYLGTWELPYERSAGGLSEVFKEFRSIAKNRSFRLHIAMYIAAYGAMDILMAWFKFYLLDYIGKGGFVTIGLGSLLITQILALPVYVSLANRRGHAFAYRLGLSIWLSAMVAMFFQGPHSPVWLLALNCVAIGAGLGAGTLIPFQILPFVTDVDELITGRKRAGLYAGAMTLIRKLIQGAFVLPLLGLLLSTIGYLGPVPRAFTQEQFFGELKPRVAAAVGPEAWASVEESYHEVRPGYFALSVAASAADKREVRRVLDRAQYKGFGAEKEPLNLIQAPDTVSALRYLFVLSPALLIAVGIAVSFRFPINPASHAAMSAELARLKAGGDKAQASPEARAVCERLSGLAYDELFQES